MHVYGNKILSTEPRSLKDLMLLISKYYALRHIMNVTDRQSKESLRPSTYFTMLSKMNFSEFFPLYFV